MTVQNPNLNYLLIIVVALAAIVYLVTLSQSGPNENLTDNDTLVDTRDKPDRAEPDKPDNSSKQPVTY